MEIKPKVILKQKGASAALNNSNFLATMRWKTSVDVDLHVLYETKEGKTGEVYYGNKRHSGNGYQIKLDGDAGVGNSLGSQGYNEENIEFSETENLKRALICTNIFSGATSYASIGAHVLVGSKNKMNEPDVQVTLTSQSRDKWCAIAEIDFSGISPVIKSIDDVSSRKPELSSKGLFGKIFGR